MEYVTIYTHTVKRRKTGIVETVGCAYRTKSLTAMHRHLHQTCPDAQTWRDPKQVITDFILGMNLGCRPLVVGGDLVDMRIVLMEWKLA